MILVAHRTPPTRAGCEQVADAGANVFEADVQVDADGEIVVSHYLPFGVGGRLQRDNWRLRWHTAGARDVRLADLADLVPDRCRLLLDVTEPTAAGRARLADALAVAVPDRSRYVVCGHLGEEVGDALRAAGFRTWRTVGSRRQLAAVRAAGRLPDDAVTVRHSLLNPEVLAHLHDQAPRVIAWTVNSGARAGLLGTLGVDGVTTDSAAVLRLLAGNSN